MNRKTSILACIVLLCGLCITPGCESDSEEPTPTVNSNNNNTGGPDGNSNNQSAIEGCQYPVAEVLNANTLNIETGSFKVLNASHTVYQVFGFSFTVAFAGSVKELGISVPETGTYTVRVYNAEIGKDDILAEKDITVSNGDWTYVNIDPLVVDPDLTYVVGIYFQSKPEEQETLFNHIPNFTYPAQFGDVTIEGYAINSEVGQKVKPEPKDSKSFTIFNGFVDFCFEAS